MSWDDQPDLLSDLSDMDFVRHLLADIHDDLPGKVARFEMLTDLGGQIGRSGTMIFGGHAAYHAWVEARSMSLWKRSLIELTKIIRGFFQSTGCFGLEGQSVRSKPCR